MAAFESAGGGCRPLSEMRRTELLTDSSDGSHNVYYVKLCITLCVSSSVCGS